MNKSVIRWCCLEIQTRVGAWSQYLWDAFKARRFRGVSEMH